MFSTIHANLPSYAVLLLSVSSIFIGQFSDELSNLLDSYQCIQPRNRNGSDQTAIHFLLLIRHGV